MKKSILTALFALASVAAFNSVNAQTPVSWSVGDVILGFENASHNKNLLVDLGSGATFSANLSGGTFSSIDLSLDLASAFGSDWATNGTTGLLYGIFGLPSDKSIVYASVAAGDAAPDMIGAGGLATTLSHYNTLGNGYNVDKGTQGLTVGVYQNVGSGSDTSFKTWSGNSVSVAPFATYNISIENGVSGNLDVYGTTGSTSTQLGTLTLSPTGTLSTVPEPSTYVLFGLGALVLGITLRRRAA